MSRRIRAVHGAFGLLRGVSRREISRPPRSSASHQSPTHEPDVSTYPSRPWIPPAIAGALLTLWSCASAPEQVEQRPFFPAPPDPPRVQFLRSIEAVEDVEPPRSGLDNLVFGDAKVERRAIRRPFGCAYRDGMVYVADSQGSQILRVDFKNRKMGPVPLEGRAAMQSPLGLCFSPEGLAYVTDPQRKQVVVLDKDFKWVAEFGPLGPKTRPVDVKAHEDQLYVTDAGEACVWVLERKTGKVLRKLGNQDKAEETLRGPTFVSIDPNGYAYVVDTIYSRVTVWDKDGKYIRQIGEPGDIVGTLARPKGIAWSEDNTIYVLDGAFENCQIFDLAGNPLMFFGGPGNGPGSLYLPGTVWIGRGKEGLDLFQDLIDPDFDAERLILVTSQYGPRKLNAYAFGKSRKFEYKAVALPSVPQPAPPRKESQPSGKDAKGTPQPASATRK